ncbi:hypothetical protein [Pseudomonas sp. BF-B-26]|jgi:uncharacterized lipoprotein YajG|uniref:hypothetical protein n=1 Tax=Pseudomonas sp. BF-B-26 TaxID=2832400 RepID=UPI001CC0ABF1|nr:hypothetical protein [Pseudomonas sp. BF-B-26]
MKLFVGGLAVALLAGCVSPGDLQKNDPSLKAATAKDPKRYALCVFPKWQDARSDASMSETENGYRLLVANNNMTDELLDIRKSAKGSTVTLYQRMAWSPGYGRGEMKQAINDCL